MNHSTTPAVSVIMAAHNAAATIRASIDSILAQTCRDFELIVADDGSTDDTLAVLEAVDDPRLRVVRNETNRGVVASRNRCFELARSDYVALLDSDDLSAPTRLARQLAYLEANAGTVLIGTAARTLDGGVLRRMRHPDVTTPGLIRWLLHVANPLVCSSVMFRAGPVRRHGEFMRESYIYAEDFEFYHRMAARGDISRLDDSLTIYRVHDGNMSKRNEDAMVRAAIRVLEPAYRTLFGAGAHDAAALIVEYISASHPVVDAGVLQRLSEVFDRLNDAFLAAPGTDAETARALRNYARELWRRMLHATNRQGRIGLRTLLSSGSSRSRLNPADATQMAFGMLPLRSATRAMWRRVRTTTTPAPRSGELYGVPYVPVVPDAGWPPTLFVVVDTEAEFDWSKPFSRDLTAVSAMDDIERGQAVFDRYGVRPIYAVDYPIASQERGFAGLRAIMERDGCAIGAHLHPWTTPPFEEEASSHNSYPGNLRPELEERKLATLMDTIRGAFGISPVFYKAGRYGFGPATAAALVRHGIRVDLSVLPGADLRRRGGPDFRRLASIPYRIDNTSVLTVPMTRSHVGLAPSLRLLGEAAQDLPVGRLLRLNSVLARLGLAETITLTPEGVTAGEQIRLLRSMLRRGTKLFVLHYHSPSLSAGHTPYVRDEAGVRIFLDRLTAICRFFFEDFGGLPGYPNDLLRMIGSRTPET